MKRLFLKTLHFIYVRLIGIVNPITLGVRVMLIRNDKILLVKHTYQDEWYFPGGGLKRRETLAEAVRREAMEEAGATLGDLEFFGIYTNIPFRRTDHIAVFLCKDFTFSKTKDWEIDAIELFPFDALPKNVAPGIGRRIEDYKDGVQPKNAFGDW
ncbi:MAG: NUDIX domain-containing protein [Anaerolineae bacterium]|jgi:8-oxo-dGTP pyrophosphatase MutT (NUDIX family)|nr:NUDIX domain-containing protein [Anaerolineae bacterium]MBT7069378.1 NUDIX domain-containing protein [Anaerolineae bacterium]MBT7326834.1 NUDIX domain-containing protein [Anaerolineae bacterium]